MKLLSIDPGKTMHYKTVLLAMTLLSSAIFTGTAAARAVSDIQITIDGKSSGDDAESIRRCERFKPTATQLRRYFAGAYPISEGTRAKRYTSQCYAEGRVMFFGQDEAEWRVYSGGGATLNWIGGGDAQLLNPERIWTEPKRLERSVDAPVHPVKRLHIEQSGKAAETSSTRDLDADLCKRFRPTRAQLIHYFSRAEVVPGVYAVHQYYSPCYAEGQITFKDGEQGHWYLRSSGFATLTWSSGDSVDLRYLPADWHDPIGGYDEG